MYNWMNGVTRAVHALHKKKEDMDNKTLQGNYNPVSRLIELVTEVPLLYVLGDRKPAVSGGDSPGNTEGYTVARTERNGP